MDNSDLSVLVVESDKEELKIICDKLKILGIVKLHCMTNHEEILDILEKIGQLDLVIAEFNQVDNYSTGLFLCQIIKMNMPDTVFIINLKENNVSFMFRSLYSGADDYVITKDLDLNRKLTNWIDVAKARSNFKGNLYGRDSQRSNEV